MSLINLTAKQLHSAATIKEKIAKLEKKLSAMLGGTTAPAKAPSTPKVPRKKKRKMSAAGRKKIAEAARKRWALIKAGKAASPFAKSSKKKAAKG